MKKIKTVNGYAIYQAVSERDAENYRCAVGSYNLYLATDVRDYGLANSSPEYEDIDSLANALELANGSNHAIAEALAEELGGSTCIDMDLVLEIERRLDAGEDQEAIREALEPCVLDEDDGGEYAVSAYHVGIGEYGNLGTVEAESEEAAWLKGYALAAGRIGYEPDSILLTKVRASA